MKKKRVKKEYLKRMSKVLDNISLRNKVNIINIIALTIIFTGMTVGVNIIIKTYNNTIYQSTLDNLRLSTAGIDKRLRNIETISDYIIADDVLQSGLSAIKDKKEVLAGRKGITQITERMYRYFGYDTGLASITVVDDFNRVMRSSENNKLAPDVLLKGCSIAEEQAGKGVWMIDDLDHASIVYVRQIRRIKNLKLDNLGTVLIQVRLNKIVDEELKNILYDEGLKSGRIYILHQNQVVYPIGTDNVQVMQSVKQSSQQGYNILKLDGERFFATYNKLNKLDLEYAFFMPYERIYKAIHRINTTIYIFNFVLFIGAMFLTALLINQVTKHFKYLVFQMRRFEENHFENKMLYNERYMQRKDEVGFLYTTFYYMAENIDKLIHDNLKKQILIKDTQLKSLVSQINPHFLYNTLNSINWIAKLNRQSQISEMVEALASLMRMSMDTNTTMISLEKELEIVENYILIQKVRYGEKLLFERAVQGEVVNTLIPKLCIQPLVENSIRHVLENSTEICRIKVGLVCEKEWFEILISDNGKGIDEDILEKLHTGEVKPKNTGIGLNNIQERIQLIYGQAYGLSFQKQEEGTIVHLRIPFEKGEQKDA